MARVCKEIQVQHLTSVTLKKQIQGSLIFCFTLMPVCFSVPQSDNQVFSSKDLKISGLHKPSICVCSHFHLCNVCIESIGKKINLLGSVAVPSVWL